MGYAAWPETLLTSEYGCRGSQRVNVAFADAERFMSKKQERGLMIKKIWTFAYVNMQDDMRNERYARKI